MIPTNGTGRGGGTIIDGAAFAVEGGGIEVPGAMCGIVVDGLSLIG